MIWVFLAVVLLVIVGLAEKHAWMRNTLKVLGVAAGLFVIWVLIICAS